MVKKLAKIKKSKSLSRVFQLVTLMVISTACNQKQPHGILETACLPPCWADIHPGITSLNDSLTILQTHDRVEKETVQVFEWVDYRRVSWYMQDGSLGMMNYENDVVSVISLSYERNLLTIGEVFDKLGEPDSFLTTHHTTEIFYLIIHFLYPESGVVVLSRIDNFIEGDTAVVGSNMRVDFIFYFVPDRFESVMTEGDIYGQAPEDLQRIRAWRGFGEIEIVE